MYGFVCLELFLLTVMGQKTHSLIFIFPLYRGQSSLSLGAYFVEKYSTVITSCNSNCILNSKYTQ